MTTTMTNDWVQKFLELQTSMNRFDGLNMSRLERNQRKRFQDFLESDEGIRIVVGAVEYAQKDKTEGRESTSRKASMRFFKTKPNNYHDSLNIFFSAYVFTYNRMTRAEK
jgi:hypothetical protein